MMERLLSTKEVAELLNINEKMVYTLIAEKGLPATKITGKWSFPTHLVEQWVEAHTHNYPETRNPFLTTPGLLIITGSNDPLLEKTISVFNSKYPEYISVFGNLGSMGGLRALRRKLCHMASSHLLQEDESEYNFEFAFKELDELPAIVNFCKREQGILIQKGNPKSVTSPADIAKPGIRMVNRPLGTGTRLLLDHEFQKAGIDGSSVEGYSREVFRHMDVGLEILAGRADAGPAIRAVAGVLDLDFIPLRWERYDLLILKERFFDESIQRFLEMIQDKTFKTIAGTLDGYDVTLSGKMVYPAAVKK